MSAKTTSVLLGLGAVLGAAEPLVPVDKHLDPAWVASLTQRGAPTILRGAELAWVGMPVGGQFAGQVYLGGDGTLWLWDIFNRFRFTTDKNGNHYEKPLTPDRPFRQGFDLTVGGRTWALDRSGFRDIAFCGQYPVGTVDYRDEALPLSVRLEAFSPFIPLDSLESGLPATILRYTLRNPSTTAVTATLRGFLDNPVGLDCRTRITGTARNRRLDGADSTILTCSAEEVPVAASRPDILFEDWSHSDYRSWTVSGTAFGRGPIAHPAQGAAGDDPFVVDSNHAAPGSTAAERDAATGSLTSSPFTIERRFLSVRIAGGTQKVGLQVVVDGTVVGSVFGAKHPRLETQIIDLGQWQGRTATIRIVDDATGSWGNIIVGRIMFTDVDRSIPFPQRPDIGTFCLVSLDGTADAQAGGDSSGPLASPLPGELARTLTVPAGGSVTATFAFTWHFPNLTHIPAIPQQGRFYASRFDSATAVAQHLAGHRDRLIGDTLAWRDTWYDSTLPHWFLDRTFTNISTLATTTSHRFRDGRQWAWEGVGNCAGTCGHVYYYGQATARLFPDLEREQREKVDFTSSMKDDGAIRFRGQNNGSPAIDAQAGYILRALREHQMSGDGAFLGRVYPAVKKATQWLITQDGNGDGLIEGAQHNTLDTDWYGASAWLSGIYQAGLQAAAAMADEMNDQAFATTCRTIAGIGQGTLVSELYNGEYFQNRVDPAHPESVNSGSGCFIDQVIGQSWAFQVGLPRIFPRTETHSALQALWTHNYTPDVGPYRAVNKPGRWYAMPGEAGLLMCTFPRPDWDLVKATGVGKGAWAAMYFNECMNGFEHQVAGHMLWEGMVQEGLAIERTIHDRYGASKRNPWNEVECGDHYGRSMASYGVFTAVCGATIHGPKAHLGFDPRLTPDDFRAAFTAPAGWGTFAQQRTSTGMNAALAVRWGTVTVKTLGLHPLTVPTVATARLGTESWPLAIAPDGDGRVVLTFPTSCTIATGQTMQVELR